MDKSLNIIGIESGIAAKDKRCEDGPKAFYQSNAMEELPAELISKLDWEWIKPDQLILEQDGIISAVREICLSVSRHVSMSIDQNEKFCCIGGDHAYALGTWAAAAQSFKGRLGLLWVDAHMDAHTFETTSSNCIHGMPMAALLGHGDKALAKLLNEGPALQAEQIILLGIRCYEPEEKILLNSLGIKIIYMEEILEKGLDVIFQEIWAYFQKHCDGLGISIDLDAFDPTECPGVGTPEKDGMSSVDFLKALKTMPENIPFLGCEIMEFNPHLDKLHQTEHVMANIIRTLFL